MQQRAHLIVEGKITIMDLNFNILSFCKKILSKEYREALLCSKFTGTFVNTLRTTAHNATSAGRFRGELGIWTNLNNFFTLCSFPSTRSA